MSWGFEAGKVYHRRDEIHARFGGQQQGGIITPSNHALIIIVTGEEGLQHGYGDRYRSDGIFEYFGEGQIGDMELVRGNRAIHDHSVAGKSLLLFRKTTGGLRFEGEMVCEAFHREPAPDREGRQRSAIVFELRRLDAVSEVTEIVPSVDETFENLRRRAYAAAVIAVPSDGPRVRNIYERSRDVRRYILARAKGICEGCASAAPFIRSNGQPYLECHHLTRVSDGGPDHPAHVIALCPNCHRRVHAGADGGEYNRKLASLMRSIEAVTPPEDRSSLAPVASAAAPYA